MASVLKIHIFSLFFVKRGQCKKIYRKSLVIVYLQNSCKPIELVEKYCLHDFLSSAYSKLENVVIGNRKYVVIRTRKKRII